MFSPRGTANNEVSRRRGHLRGQGGTICQGYLGEYGDIRGTAPLVFVGEWEIYWGNVGQAQWIWVGENFKPRPGPLLLVFSFLRSQRGTTFFRGSVNMLTLLSNCSGHVDLFYSFMVYRSFTRNQLQFKTFFFRGFYMVVPDKNINLVVSKRLLRRGGVLKIVLIRQGGLWGNFGRVHNQCSIYPRGPLYC